jgi:hypothetical protein
MEPKRINTTYTGDGNERVDGTYASKSGVVHGVRKTAWNGMSSLCGMVSWHKYSSAGSLKRSGKVKDITCKSCLKSA